MKEKKIKGRKMKQKLISLIALLAVGALLAGCLAPSEDKGADWLEPGVEGIDYLLEPAEPGWNWYVSKEAGFRMKYPTDWKDFDADAFGFSIDDPQKDGSFFYGSFYCTIYPMKTVKETLGKIDSPWQAAKIFIEGEKRLESRIDIKLLELTNFTIDGTPAAKAVYTYQPYSPELGKRIGTEEKEIYITLIKGKYFYEVSYEAEVDAFNKYYPTIEKMIKSFEFI
jgi:hypothetical protein